MSSVRKRRLPSGKSRWVVDYKDMSGKRRSAQFPLQRDAEAYRKRVERELHANTHTPRILSPTFSEAAAEWLLRKQRDVAEVTHRPYRGHVKNHLNPFIGGVKTCDVDHRLREQLARHLYEYLSDPQTRHVFMTFQMIMNYSVLMGWGGSAGQAKHYLKRKEKSEIIIPDKKYIVKLLQHDHDVMGGILSTAILAGLRPSETLGLLWMDVDFDNSHFHIKRKLDDKGKLGKTKTPAGVRSVPMAPLIIKRLEKLKAKTNGNPDDFVFKSIKGKPISAYTFKTYFWYPTMTELELVNDINRPLFQFRCLRHAAASLFIEQGWPPKKVQTMMGHESIQTTYDRYGHLFPTPQDDVVAVANMEKSLFGRAKKNK